MNEGKKERKIMRHHLIFRKINKKKENLETREGERRKDEEK